MSQDVPVTGYAILGLLTFGDELTGYEIKQRADVTLRFYWVSPAMSQIYTELRRLTGLGLVRADARPDDGREVTTYAITDAGQQALRDWMDQTPAGFPVLKHTVLLRLLIGHASEPEQTRRMLAGLPRRAGAGHDRPRRGAGGAARRGPAGRAVPVPVAGRRLGARLLRRRGTPRPPCAGQPRGRRTGLNRLAR